MEDSHTVHNQFLSYLQKGEADAMSLDGGFAYIAGHCGLVPVLGENYREWDSLLLSGRGHRNVKK